MPPPPGLKIDIGHVEEREVTKQQDITQGGTVHVGELIVSATGLLSSSGEVMRFSLDDVSVSDSGFFLGRGSSGSVRRVRRAGTGQLMALKEIKVTSQAHIQEIRSELQTLYHHGAGHQCPYLVEFLGAYSHEGSVYIAMECMDGSLADLKDIPCDVLALMARDVLQGLQFLHGTRHLIHRDLKPSNVLFSISQGMVKISDFGVSSTLDCAHAHANTFVGTVTYMSPERLRGEPYSSSADIWSLGIGIAELALGCHPYSSMTSKGESTEARFWVLMQHLNNDNPSLALPDSMEPALRDFIERCLIKDPTKRPSAETLLSHPFISNSSVGASEAELHERVKHWFRQKGLAEQKEHQKSTPQAKTGGSVLDLDSALKRLVDMKKR